MKLMIRSVFAACAVACVLPSMADQARVEHFKREFTSVQRLELPARAASVVTAAKAAERVAVAEDAVSAALAVHRAAGPMVVGAVAQANPAVAGAVVAKAVSLQPRQLSQIVSSAVGAAPTEVETIVKAVTQTKPAAFDAIALAAVKVAPKSAVAVARGLAAGSPALDALLKRANPTGVPVNDSATLAALLARVKQWVVALSNETSPDVLLAGGLSAKMMASLPTTGMGALSASSPPTAPPYTPVGTPETIRASETVPAPIRSTDYSTP